MSVVTTPLRHMADVRVSNVDKKSVDGETPVRLCNYTDVYYSDVIRDDREYMAATASPAQLARFKLEVGDTLITKDSETAEDIAVSAYVAEEAPDLVCGYHLAILRPRQSLVEPRFLSWATRSDYVREQFAVEATGVTRFGLRYESVLGVDVPTPPLERQERIADFLDDQGARIDEVIRLRQRQVEALELLLIERSRVLTTGSDLADTKATGVEWMPMVASGWAIPKVSHVFDTGSGTTPASDHPEYFDGSVPWVNTAEVRDGFIHQTAKSVTTAALREYPTLKVYDSGSLVVAMYGQGVTKGRVGIMTIPAAVNQACCVLAARGEVPSMWAYFWFRAFKAEIVQLAVGSGQPNLNQELIRALRLPVPPPRAMEDRMRSLESLKRMTDQAIVEMRTQIDLLHERKRSLITAAVTGEFDVSTASGRGVA